MMTPQGLQIAPPEDSLARLGIIANGIVIVNIVFRVCIADCRRVPVRIQGRTDLFLLHGLPPSYFASDITVHYPLFLSFTTQAGASFLCGANGRIYELCPLILLARSAALRPSKPKPGFHPNTRKRACWGPGLLGAAAREPAAQGKNPLATLMARVKLVP
jgi:hypothetical protein